MENYFTVSQYGNGGWAVALPYKTTVWATKTLAENNAKKMAKKLGYVLVDGAYVKEGE